MKLFSISSEPIIKAFGWMLLHAVWQGFVVALVAAGVLFLLRRRASYGRYWAGISALLLQVVVSIATFALYYQPRVLQAALPAVSGFTQPLMTKGSQVMITLPWYKQTLWFLQSNLETIVLFWVIGASVLLLRLAGSWVYVQQLKAEGIRLTESRIQEMFRRIAATLNIRSTVHLFESVRVSTPVVIGFIRPVVLLPVGLATGLTTKQIEAILAHELAHVKRFDYLVNLLQSLAEVVYFFHPALWWVSSRVRIEREHCCDDIAIEVCGDKLAFARALAEVESFRQSPALAMAFASKKGMMLQRVKRVLGVTEKPQRRMSPNLLILFVLLVFGVSVYAFQQDGKPKTNKAKTSKFSHKSDIVIIEKDGEKIEMNEVNGDLKLTKVMWKHRQLSKEEVAELQILKEKINAGQLNLDNVEKEQRDILLYIIEKENQFNDGMQGMGKGLEQLSEALGEISIDTENLAHIIDSVKVDGKWVQTADFSAKVDLNMSFDERKMQEHHRRIDSLSRLMEPQHQKMEALRLEMEQHEFKVNELERKMEVLEWKKNKAAEERSQVLEKRSQIMHQDGQKVKKAEAEIEKDIEQFEAQIKQRETQMQQLNQQIGELRQQMKTVRQPLADLEVQMEKLEKINEELSQKMEAESSAIELMAPPPPPMPVEAAPRIRTPKAVKAATRVKETAAPRATPAPARKN